MKDREKVRTLFNDFLDTCEDEIRGEHTQYETDEIKDAILYISEDNPYVKWGSQAIDVIQNVMTYGQMERADYRVSDTRPNGFTEYCRFIVSAHIEYSLLDRFGL